MSTVTQRGIRNTLRESVAGTWKVALEPESRKLRNWHSKFSRVICVNESDFEPAGEKSQRKGM